jgi:predicted  nucleic acid-binding Zn-ribbon protein
MILLAAWLLSRLLWAALRFVLRGGANAALSYFLTERVLKRLSPPDERAGSREAGLSRELGRREGTEEALRARIERERRRADRLETELKKARRPWWRRFLG